MLFVVACSHPHSLICKQNNTQLHSRCFFDHRLVIGQQGCSLSILADDLATREGITSQQARHAYSEREQEEKTANGESEDPLKLEEMRASKELSNAGCCESCQ
jgi:hypothetical protein